MKDVFEFRRPPMDELLAAFDQAHQLIWKKEKLDPQMRSTSSPSSSS